MRVELSRASLDLQLAPGDIGSALSQRTFQTLDLDERLGVSAPMLLCQPPGQLENLVAIRVFSRFLPLGLPARRLP